MTPQSRPDSSLSLLGETRSLTLRQYAALLATGLGILSFAVNVSSGQALVPLWLATLLSAAGITGYARTVYLSDPGAVVTLPKVFRDLENRGAWAWLLAVCLSGFYACLYWWPGNLTGLVDMMDPLSRLLRDRAADHWFVYGTLYTLAVILMGIRFMMKHRGNRYQLIRTGSVMFFQLGLAFLLPAFLQYLNEPEYYFTYFWPLKYDYLFPDSVHWLLESSERLGVFLVGWGLAASFVLVPVLTYFFGKRWYCSWVCGCGALAETAGDPFRRLSDKSLRAWRIERWMVHGVLVFVVVTTLLLWLNVWLQGTVLGGWSGPFARAYGFLVGAVFSGVIGTGFYPLLGNRVWCRFGCPQAAILGILQKYLSRFRITTNGGQCISCGNCSAYCEMGIDVKWYAQRGQDIVRASCVGCGICSAVCPRGVLRLENGPMASRRHKDSRLGLTITGDGVRLED